MACDWLRKRMVFPLCKKQKSFSISESVSGIAMGDTVGTGPPGRTARVQDIPAHDLHVQQNSKPPQLHQVRRRKRAGSLRGPSQVPGPHAVCYGSRLNGRVLQVLHVGCNRA
jgi:hypothetical protein